MAGETVRAFRSWFWRPPRPHGATVHDRQVSNLELFYDLVYVAVIGQAAHHLAEDVTVSAIAGFAVVFAMIWFAWMNGSLYLEIHGRQDGRTRTVVFLQMGILVVLAAFTAEATGESGGTFAVVYAVLFAVMGWLWYSVGGLDVAEYRTLTGVYVTGMVLSVVTALVSAVLPADLRLLVWAAFVVAWLVAIVAFGRMREFALAVTPTHSLVERFGQFTIIVLGEVIVGVVGGLADAMQDPITIATGLLGLFVGFGFWWSYFDIVGRRLPRAAGPANARWLLGHLPITMAIAGAGAAMTSLIVQGPRADRLGDDRLAHRRRGGARAGRDRPDIARARGRRPAAGGVPEDRDDARRRGRCRTPRGLDDAGAVAPRAPAVGRPRDRLARRDRPVPRRARVERGRRRGALTRGSGRSSPLGHKE